MGTIKQYSVQRKGFGATDSLLSLLSGPAGILPDTRDEVGKLHKVA